MRVRARRDALEPAQQNERYHRLTENIEYFVLGIYNDESRGMDDDGESIMFPKDLRC